MKPAFDLAFIVYVLLHRFDQGDGARILGFFPFPVKSHHRVFEPLLKGLAASGHQVTYLTPYPPDEQDLPIKHIVIKNYISDLLQAVSTLGGGMRSWLPLVMGRMGGTLAEKVLQDPDFIKLIESDSEFDLILSEITVLHEAFAPIAHRFNAISVEVLPSGNLHWTWALYGNPYDTSYIIDTSVVYTDHMNWWERIHNTFNSIAMRFVRYYCYMPTYQIIADKYFRYPGWEKRPPLDTLIRNASLVLVNSHHTLNYPFPLASNVKDIGGINILPKNKPLPKDLQEFMDGAKDGLIYFTLGSHNQVSSTLGEPQKKAFYEVFKNLKQRVLWKWEKEFADLPDNIRISKWFPQQDILVHKNLKLFITHGGFLSLAEAVYSGVPLIGIPIMGDQYKNTRHMEYYEYGIPLYLENITTESLSWAINHVISNPFFAENAKMRSSLYRDKKETPMETALYWIEYVLRHKGAKHLRPAIADMPWYQQAMIDVYLVLAAIVLVPLYIIYKFIRCLLRYITCSTKNREASKRKND